MTDKSEISHREIYERVISLEGKVDDLKKNTSGLVDAFKAAQGAFAVLEFMAKLAKPILWIAALGAAMTAAWSQLKVK